MADSALKRLVVQASHYSLTGLFSMIAGLVTFPLLTRIFSVEEYGVMNLVAATLTVSVTVGKVGVQHSIVRYHSEIAAGKSRFTLRQLYSTTFFGMTSTALLTMLILTTATQLAPARWLSDARLRGLIAIVSLIIVVQVIESALVSFLRAEQRTVILMKYQVAKKYLGLGCIFVAVLAISRSLTAFYSASVVSEALAVATLGYLLFSGRDWPRPVAAQFSRPLYLELLRFGVPMMIGYELAGTILAVGDRYVIAGLLGEAPVGLYGAAYNLCQYIQAVVIVSVSQAIMPIYMQMWDQQGAAETSAFISQSLRTYVLFGAPVIAGLAAVGPALLPSLASDKYASAAAILPWVIAGMVVDGGTSMVGAGLFIHRKTLRIMAIVLGCAILNIVLNLILVPRLGILGAAVATLISYLASTSAMTIAGRRLVPVAIPWATIARAGLASMVMYAAVTYVYPGRHLLTVGVRIAIGAPVYAILMVLMDSDARALVRKARDRIRR